MSEHARNIAPPAMPLGLRIKASPEYRTFKTQFWDDNPLFRQILGVCSALAVTNLVTNTLVMCVAVTLVTACSSCLSALVRDATPPRTRLLVQMLIIASFVIVVHLFLAAYMFAVSEQIGAYVGLIITNCIVLGRVEAFATKNRPWLAFVDGIGAGCGYSLVLILVSLPRELLGFGSLCGVAVVPESLPRWNIMVMAPAGFFGLAVVIWVCRALQLRAQAGKARPGGK